MWMCDIRITEFIVRAWHAGGNIPPANRVRPIVELLISDFGLTQGQALRIFAEHAARCKWDLKEG